MKIVWLTLGLAISTVAVYAQSDSAVIVRPAITPPARTIPDPQSKYNNELPHDIGAQKDSVMLTGKQIPKKLLRTLNRDQRYTGWEDDGIYLNTNTNVYMLYLTQDSLVTKYGFDKQGKTISYVSFIRKN